MVRKIKAYILLIITVIFFAGNILVGKAINDIPPITMALIRCSIAFFVILPFSIKEIKLHSNLWKKEWKVIIGLSLSGIALFNALLYGSLRYTTSMNVAIIESTTPVFTIILGMFLLKEKLNRIQFFGIFLSLVGAIWVIAKGSIEVILQLQFNIGDLIAILAVISWAVYSILVKQHNLKFPTYGGVTILLFTAVVFLFPFAIFEWRDGILHLIDIKSSIGLLYLGIFPAVLALIFWNMAVAEIGPSRASIFLNLLPVFTVIGAVFFLGETVTLVQLLGGFFVIIGVYLSTKESRKLPTKEKNTA